MNGNRLWAMALVLGGGGAPLAADELVHPVAIAVAPDGSIFVADRALPGIWKMVDDKYEIYFKGDKKLGTPLNAVRCLAIDADGKLLAGDSATRDVYRLDGPNATPVPLTKGSIGIPMGIAVAANGDMYVSDLELHRIVKVAAAGGTPELVARLPGPIGIAVDQDAAVWVVTRVEDMLRRVLPDGKVEVVAAGRPFQFAHQVVLDKSGTAFVSDGYAKTIWRIQPGQAPEKLAAGEPFENPVGLAWSGESLLVADSKAQAVFRVAPDGAVQRLGGE